MNDDAGDRRARPPRGRLPTRQELIDYLAARDGDTGRRDLARAFGLRGAQRAELRRLLRSLEDDGTIERGHRRRVRPAGTLPPVIVIVVDSLDDDGEPLARPASWSDDGAPPAIRFAATAGRPAPGVGERWLARLARQADGSYLARPMKRVDRSTVDIIGEFRATGDGGRIAPVERQVRDEVAVAPADIGGAGDGDLVIAELLPGRRDGLARARVKQRIAHRDDAQAISAIAIAAAGAPVEFDRAALALAERAAPAPLDGRDDLRALPLVTIDGEDARDFDDAVFAEPDGDSGNRGGWHLVVAIADVAWYVRPGDALDRAARTRGNSIYFPDRVVPMLPARLSNELCSLAEGADRPCLAAHLWIGADGTLRRHRFVRALMRSAARLTYDGVQGGARWRRRPPGRSSKSSEPLYGAYATLAAARAARGALEIELPERRVVFDAAGDIAAIAPMPRLDSHRLIEEFMIAANVAAARELERLRQPCMYRVHDEPDRDKVRALSQTLAEHGLKLPRGQILQPRHFNALLTRIADTPQARLVNELVLRAQMQAAYSPEKIGHFGLALDRYAHFTSPIRRYADLLVHRALIAGLDLGPGGLDAGEADFAALGEHICAMRTPRRRRRTRRDGPLHCPLSRGSRWRRICRYGTRRHAVRPVCDAG